MTTSSKQTAPAYVAAPRSLHYEFGGPLGALGVTLAVPFFTYCKSSLPLSPLGHPVLTLLLGRDRARIRLY
jgi:hypothetical protein